MSKKMKTAIGLEVHVQLKTKSKMFCYCDNDILEKSGFKIKKISLIRDFKDKFSDYSGLWQAHILRNHIVHEPDFEVYKFTAQKAINSYKKALEDLKIKLKD